MSTQCENCFTIIITDPFSIILPYDTYLFMQVITGTFLHDQGFRLGTEIGTSTQILIRVIMLLHFNKYWCFVLYVDCSD